MARVSSTHLTFGPDPATSMTVSWLGGASSPVLYAPVDAGAVDGSAAVDAPGSTDAGLWVPDDAERAAPTSSLSRGPGRRRVQVEHARLTGLRPGTRYGHPGRCEVARALGAPVFSGSLDGPKCELVCR